MTDRDAIRREAFTEVIAYAEQKAARHYALMEQARSYDKTEMAQRAEHAVNAWKGVAVELRLRYGIPE